MARDQRLTAVFQIRDQMSPVIKSISKSWTSMAKVINSTDFSNLQKKIRYARRALGDFGEGISSTLQSVAGPMAALSASIGFSLQGIVQNFMDTGGAIDDAAQRMGLSIESLQTMRYAAQMTGSSIQTFDSAMTKFSANLASVAAGKNEDLASLFKALGISVRDADGNIRSATDLLPEFADGFERNTNGALRARMAMALFGKSGVELIPMLSGGAQGLDTLAKRAHDLGLVMSEEDVQASAKLGDQFDEMRLTMRALSNSFGAKLAPALGEWFERTQKIIVVNREAFSEKFGDVVNEFSKSLRQVDFEAIISGMIRFADVSLKVINAIGGFSTIIQGLGLLIGAKAVISIIGFASSFMTLASSLMGAAAAAKAFGLSMVAAMGPVGPVLWGIGLVASLVLANWDKIWPILKEGISGFVTWASDNIGPLADKFINVGQAIYSVWKSLFTGDLRGVLAGMDDLIIAAFDLLPNGVSDVLKESYEAVKDVFKSIGSFISDFFSGLRLSKLLPDWMSAFSEPTSPQTQPQLTTDTGIYETMPVAGRGTMSGQMRIGVYGYNGAQAQIERIDSSDNLEIIGDVGYSPRRGGD